MDRILRLPYLAIVASLIILSSLSPVQAATQAYCSSQNTASGSSFFWTYQSNGKCTDYCNGQGTYAFAIIQYTDCWCSNYIPSSQTDLSRCQVDCPGYPDEKCGSKDDGLYIYLKLAGQASGTAGASSASSTVVSSSSVVSSTRIASSSAAITPSSAPSSEASTSRRTSVPVTVTQTVIRSVITTAVAPSPTIALTNPSSRASSTLQTVSSSVSRDQTTVQVITESGAIVTRTVILPPSSTAESQTSTGDSKSNTGAIVGGAVGGVVGIALIIGGILFLLWRRRKQQAQDQDAPANITRNTSTMSKAGLLGGKMEKDNQYPSKISTRFGSQNSRQDRESVSPASGSGRRYSQPLVFDSRLNPTQLMVFDNSSHGSIDDSHDYGRRLGVANPDPPNRESIDRS